MKASLLHHYNLLPILLIVIANHQYFHWLYHKQGSKALFIMGSGAFMWLFLVVAKPFGINNSNVSELHLDLLLLPIGVTWCLLIYMTDFVVIRLVSVRIDKDSKVDFIVWLLKLFGIIHLLFVARGLLCDWECVDLREYVELWVAMFLLVGLAYLPYSLYARYRYYHSLLAQGPSSSYDLVLEGLGTETLKVNASEVAYIKADDNYSDIFLAKQGIGPEKSSIRATLTSLEQQLDGHSQFMRIHRSYLINSGYFSSYERANNSIVLDISGQLAHVPVSKTYKAVVDKVFVHPK
ncbi:MAG: LytTR family DNA-binding domain-containing protein [Imperialibacter sp.]